MNGKRQNSSVPLSHGSMANALLKQTSERQAGLIRGERKGVEFKNSTGCQEVKKNCGPMVVAILRGYVSEGNEPKH